MITVTAAPPRTAYTQATANMQVDPAVRPSGRAVESISDLSATCMDRIDLDWVPEREAATVPLELREMCLTCPVRVACLMDAIDTDSEGYWAGTTTRDRRLLTRRGPATLAEADRLVAAQLAADARLARHRPGEGDLRWYRQGGCRCSECRRANAHNRSQQRARARSTNSAQSPRPSAA